MTVGNRFRFASIAAGIILVALAAFPILNAASGIVA
jgi:hypothetical protein